MVTTDDLNEVFDVVDENDLVLGKTTRREVHLNKNLIHRSVGIAVFNSRQMIFLQRRSVTKDTDALLWTISCSGHVRAGDNYENAAKRELHEELGISDVALNLLSKYIYEGKNETEITTLYKVNYDGEITLLKEEILEGRFFTKADLTASVTAKEVELNKYGRKALQKLGWL